MTNSAKLFEPMAAILFDGSNMFYLYFEVGYHGNILR